MAFNVNDYYTHYNGKDSQPRNIKDFESKFEARIEDSREYKQYVRRMPYNMWDGKLPFDTEVEVVPMKAVHLTRDNLERLIREQESMDRWMDEAEYAKKVLTSLRKDEQVRNDNPVVQNAYMKYLMLLELARK